MKYFQAKKICIWNNLLCVIVITFLIPTPRFQQRPWNMEASLLSVHSVLGYHQHCTKLQQRFLTQYYFDILAVCAGDQHDFALQHWLFWPLGHWSHNCFNCCQTCIHPWMSISYNHPMDWIHLTSSFFTRFKCVH